MRAGESFLLLGLPWAQDKRDAPTPPASTSWPVLVVPEWKGADGLWSSRMVEVALDSLRRPGTARTP